MYSLGVKSGLLNFSFLIIPVYTMLSEHAVSISSKTYKSKHVLLCCEHVFELFCCEHAFELFSLDPSAQSQVLAICLSSRFTLFVQLFKYLSSHLCNYYEPYSWKYGKAWLCFRAVTFTFTMYFVCDAFHDLVSCRTRTRVL